MTLRPTACLFFNEIGNHKIIRPYSRHRFWVIVWKRCNGSPSKEEIELLRGAKGFDGNRPGLHVSTTENWKAWKTRSILGAKNRPSRQDSRRRGCPEQNSFMRSFVAAWGIAQMVRSMTKQSSSSSDNVFGYGILPVRDSANPELASLR
jgi:hypothetical protein